MRTGGGARGAAPAAPVPRSEAHRLLCTPRLDRLAEFVHIVTRGFRPSATPWSLACATNPRRLLRTAGATLDVADLDLVDDRLLDELAPTLRPVRPPLTLRLVDGVGLAAHPRNGMSFGEHRCRLVAIALHHPSSGRDPSRAIVAVFAAHGIDPARPHR